MKILTPLIAMLLLASCSKKPADADITTLIEKEQKIVGLYEIKIENKNEIRREERNDFLCIQYEVDCSLTAKEDLMVADLKEPWGRVKYGYGGYSNYAPTALQVGSGSIVKDIHKNLIKKGVSFELKGEKVSLCTNLKESPERWGKLF